MEMHLGNSLPIELSGVVERNLGFASTQVITEAGVDQPWGCVNLTEAADRNPDMTGGERGLVFGLVNANDSR